MNIVSFILAIAFIGFIFGYFNLGNVLKKTGESYRKHRNDLSKRKKLNGWGKALVILGNIALYLLILGFQFTMEAGRAALKLTKLAVGSLIPGPAKKKNK